MQSRLFRRWPKARQPTALLQQDFCTSIRKKPFSPPHSLPKNTFKLSNWLHSKLRKSARNVCVNLRLQQAITRGRSLASGGRKTGRTGRALIGARIAPEITTKTGTGISMALVGPTGLVKTLSGKNANGSIAQALSRSGAPATHCQRRSWMIFRRKCKMLERRRARQGLVIRRRASPGVCMFFSRSFGRLSFRATRRLVECVMMSPTTSHCRDRAYITMAARVTSTRAAIGRKLGT